MSTGTLRFLFSIAMVFATARSAWPADLLVTSQVTRQVLRYDGATGSFEGVCGTADDPLDLVALGAGFLVGDGQRSQIQRFDAASCQDLGTFASEGGLNGPVGMGFGPDGDLYVCNTNPPSILRFAGSGEYRGVFVAYGSGGLSNPRSIAFGRDGNLYVADGNASAVLRFRGGSGAFVDAFVPSGSGGLFTPQGLVFGRDGALYVTGGVFGQGGTAAVWRFDGASGASLGAFVSSGSGGIQAPWGLLFVGGLRTITELESLLLSMNLDAKSLRAKIDAAEASLAAGNLATACNQLAAFRQEVQAHMGKSIPENQAATLLSGATEVIAALGCPP